MEIGLLAEGTREELTEPGIKVEGGYAWTSGGSVVVRVDEIWTLF